MRARPTKPTPSRTAVPASGTVIVVKCVTIASLSRRTRLPLTTTAAPSMRSLMTAAIVAKPGPPDGVRPGRRGRRIGQPLDRAIERLDPGAGVGEPGQGITALGHHLQAPPFVHRPDRKPAAAPGVADIADRRAEAHPAPGLVDRHHHVHAVTGGDRPARLTAERAARARIARQDFQADGRPRLLEDDVDRDPRFGILLGTAKP